MKTKFAKIMDIVMPILIILLIGYIAVDNINERKVKQFYEDCISFSEIIETTMPEDFDFEVRAQEYGNGNGDTVHLFVDIYNYDETMLETIENDIYPLIETKFKEFEFNNKYQKLHVDVFEMFKKETGGTYGRGVSFKEISK